MPRRVPNAPTDYADHVRAWAARLRAGSTLTWAEFLAAPGGDGVPGTVTAGVSDRASDRATDTAGPEVLPGAAQLELVRRLAPAGLPQFERLADLVLSTAGPGRGLLDVPLPWPGVDDTDRIGTPPVQPELLPAEELIRACCGVLVRLLAAEPAPSAPPVRRQWRPWRRSFTLFGAPTTAALVRAALLDAGLREGGARTTCVVLGGPFEDLMAQRWSARVLAGGGMRWQRMWRTAATNDRVPPGIDLPALAERLTAEFGPERVHLVVAADAGAALAQVAEILDVVAAPVADRYDPLATDLLRRLNPLLTLAIGDAARRVVDRVWPQVASGERSQPLGAPLAQLDWAIGTGEQMAAAVRGGRYSVHGDPALIVPTRRDGVPRGPAPSDVLRHALVVVGRTWQRSVELPPTEEAPWHAR